MRKKIDWVPAVFLTVTPVVAVVLTTYHLRTEGFLWPIWVLAAILYALTALSITAGYHRLFAHRAYEAKEWVRWLFALFGAASFQNSIYIWCRDHRIHHRFVDSNQDPYSISKGFIWAHIGWMMQKDPDRVDPRPYGRDFDQDPLVKFQHKHYVLIASVMCFGLPTLIGYFLGSALGGLAVAGFLRLVLLHHATFFINSLCHTMGTQPYTDSNSARDSLLMAIFTFGEGYHNFHHMFARDYRNGIKWYHWDPTKWCIQMFSWIGAAKSLYRAPAENILEYRLQMQEKSIRIHWSKRWSDQMEGQVEQMRARVENAQRRWELLRREYRLLKKQYAVASAEKLAEIRMNMKLAKVEFKAAYEQWKIYHLNMLRLSQARA